MSDLMKRARQDDGAAIVLLSFMMVFLLGVSAFAVDLGWLWVNGSRVQRAADSAALAGVVHLPRDQTGAFAQAANAAQANGFTNGGNATVTSAVVADTELEVTVQADVPTFFLRVFGQNPVTITKKATAEYVLPVAIGSPFNEFGTDALGLNFWASVGAEFAHKRNGDPFTTRCTDGTYGDDPDAGCDSPNGDYRSTGYYLGIEVEPGTPAMHVEIYDPSFNERANQSVETGERLLGSSNNGPDTTFRLYAADTTPYDLTDLGAPVCTRTQATDDLTYINGWMSMCGTINVSSRPGLWVLQVTTSGGGSNNSYGVRATGVGGPHPRVAGINDIGIFANVNAGLTNLYLAEVPPVHAGKTLKVSFFDAGDTQGDAFLTIVSPSGAPTCSWQVRGGGASGNSCTIQTTYGSSRPYNGKWVDFDIQIPDSAAYTCDPTSTTGCWWRVEYNFTNTAHDRTTWEVSVVGNPVRLVPNS